MPKQNPYKNTTIGTQEPKWIVPVQPVKTTSKDNGYVISDNSIKETTIRFIF